VASAEDAPRFTGKQAKITLEYLHEQCAKFRNWGKWGPDDELGTLNFVTPADIVAAAKYMICRAECVEIYSDALKRTFPQHVWLLGADFGGYHALVLCLSKLLY